MGRYKIVKQEEFVVNSAGQDSEELKNIFRGVELPSTAVVKIDQTSEFHLEIGTRRNRLFYFKFGRFFRGSDEGKIVDILRGECNGGHFADVTVQDWIEGSSLVSHVFIERDCCLDKMDCEEEEKREENKYEVEFRIVVTFCKNKFVYKRRAVYTSKCNVCGDCCFDYKMVAVYHRI